MATPRSNAYSVASGGGVYAGRPPAALTWQQLTVAPHSRRFIGDSIQGAGGGAFNDAKARACEAVGLTTVSAVPAIAFSLPVLGTDGKVYITGGLHSNYQLNEINRLTMPDTEGNTVIVCEVNHPGNMPPEGPFSGYAAGNGGYIYRQYDGGLSDNSNWQPYPGHQWTKNGFHPDWGFYSLTAHALQESYPSGGYITVGGVLQSSAAQPGDLDPGPPFAEENYGIVSYTWATGKYVTRYTTVGKVWPAINFGRGGMSDWNEGEEEIIAMQTQGGGTTYISRVSRDGTVTQLASTQAIGGADANGGDGLLIRHLEADKYLVLRQDGSGSFTARTNLQLYQESAGSGEARFTSKNAIVTAFSAYGVDPNISALSFCMDKVGRVVFWLLFPGVTKETRVFWSPYDDLADVTELEFTNPVVIPNLPYFDAWIAGCRQPMLFKRSADGLRAYLYLLSGEGTGPNDPGYINGAANWKRARVNLI